MQIETTDKRKWQVRPRFVTINYDEDGNITELEHCAWIHPDGYPELASDRPYKTKPTPEQAAAIQAALDWQPAQAIERLTRREEPAADEGAIDERR